MFCIACTGGLGRWRTVLEGLCLADLGVPTQAMRDARLRVDDPGAKVNLAAKEEWHESAIAILRQANADNEASPKQTKLQRLAAHDWLRAIDHQVQALTGWGLSAYLTEQAQHEPDQEPDQDPFAQPATHPDPVLVPIETRKLLPTSLDQCGIGMCSMMYMICRSTKGAWGFRLSVIPSTGKPGTLGMHSRGLVSRHPCFWQASHTTKAKECNARNAMQQRNMVTVTSTAMQHDHNVKQCNATWHHNELMMHARPSFKHIYTKPRTLKLEGCSLSCMFAQENNNWALQAKCF